MRAQESDAKMAKADARRVSLFVPLCHAYNGLRMTADDRLDSWKEIAAYLKRSVRTVRRWEHDEGLPVHRQHHHTLGSVYAQKSELDAWRDRARTPVAAPSEKAIAVLPFVNSSMPTDDYLAQGLTEEVTTSLSKLRALRVTSRTSARAVRDIEKSAKSIAAKLGVRYLVEGSVRRNGDRLRISAQLIDAPSDEHLWADTFDGSAADVFAMQERIARVIVDALKLRLTEDEEESLTDRPIDDVGAYESYLRARHELLRWRKDAIDRAVQLLRDALAIIGPNPRLYATLGLAYLQYREAGIDSTDTPLAKAEECAAKTGDAAAGFLLRGWIEYSRGAVQEAVRALKQCLAQEPNNTDALLLASNCYLISGRVAEARPLIARVLALDPLTPLTRCMPAFADIMEGNAAAAIEPYRQVFEMDPANPMTRLFYVWVLMINGRTDELRATAEGFPADVRQTVPAKVANFLAHAFRSDRDEAMRSLTAEIESVASAGDLFPRFLADGYAARGMTAEAIRWLEVAVDRGFINYPFLAEHDPALASLRNDPRFQQVLERVRERWTAFER